MNSRQKPITAKIKVANAAPAAATRKSKIVFIVLLFMMVLVPTSCWDQKEVEELGIVMATALDQGADGKMKVTVQILNPKGIAGGNGQGMSGGGDGGSMAYRNASGEGKTIFDGVRQVNTSIPKELYFSHNQIIIISEQLARQNITDVLDFFDRNPQIRRSNWLLISKEKNEHHDILDVPSSLVLAPSQRIVSIINQRYRSPVYVINQLGDFLELLSNEGMEAYTAGINLSTNPASTIEDAKEEINIEHTAVFRAGQMVGWLNDRESRGLLWIREGLRNGIYSVKFDQHQIALEIIQSSSKSTPVITEEGQIIMQVDIKAKASLNETMTYLDIADPATIKRLQILLGNEIKRDIQLVLEKTQQYQTDVLGFGAAVHRKYPAYWQEISPNWMEYFEQVQVDVNAEVIIPRTGLVSKPSKAAGVRGE